MSAVDETQVIQQCSAIKVTRNAKGEAQFEVKVIPGESDETLDGMRQQAVAQYLALARELA